jgi:hypothetical protein
LGVGLNLELWHAPSREDRWAKKWTFPASRVGEENVSSRSQGALAGFLFVAQGLLNITLSMGYGVRDDWVAGK